MERTFCVCMSLELDRIVMRLLLCRFWTGEGEPEGVERGEQSKLEEL